MRVVHARIGLLAGSNDTCLYETVRFRTRETLDGIELEGFRLISGRPGAFFRVTPETQCRRGFLGFFARVCYVRNVCVLSEGRSGCETVAMNREICLEQADSLGRDGCDLRHAVAGPAPGHLGRMQALGGTAPP